MPAQKESSMAELVEKLSTGRHAVALIRYQSVAEIKEAIERGFILVKFTDTRGGTEVGVALERDAVDLTDDGLGLRGSLTLDYQPVECTVSINLETLTGYGTLEPVRAA
jgi:hypothetical protein